MDDRRHRFATTARERRVVVLAIIAVVCDVLVAVAAYADRRTFLAAPTNAFLAREDNAGYAAAGIAFGAGSLLRYLVIAGLVVVLLRHGAAARRHGGHSAVTATLRRRPPIAAALVAIEVFYVAATWTQSEASAAWCVTRIATCAISLVASVLIIATVRRRPGATRAAECPV